MKKKYIQPSIKAYKIKSETMLANSESTGQIPVKQNESGPAPAKGSDFFEDDEWED